MNSLSTKILMGFPKLTSQVVHSVRCPTIKLLLSIILLFFYQLEHFNPINNHVSLLSPHIREGRYISQIGNWHFFPLHRFFGSYSQRSIEASNSATNLLISSSQFCQRNNLNFPPLPSVMIFVPKMFQWLSSKNLVSKKIVSVAQIL